ADAGRHAQPPQGGATVGDQDLRLDLQEPERSPGGGPHRRSAAGGGRLPRSAHRRGELLREARQLHRQPWPGHHRRRGGPDRGGTAPGQAALRRRAGARGPGAGGGGAAMRRGPAMTLWARIVTRRRLRLVLAAVVVLGALLAGGWFWFRDSSLVAVKHVSVTGESGPDASAIRSALTTAATNMTTLDVDMGQLRTAVLPYPAVKDL